MKEEEKLPEMDAETLLRELLIESTKLDNQLPDDHGTAILGDRSVDPSWLEEE